MPTSAKFLPHLCKGAARSKVFIYSCSLTLTRFIGFLQRILFVLLSNSISVFQREARSFSWEQIRQQAGTPAYPGIGPLSFRQHERQSALAAHRAVHGGFGIYHYERTFLARDGGASNDGVARAHLPLEAHIVNTCVERQLAV